MKSSFLSIRNISPNGVGVQTGNFDDSSIRMDGCFFFPFFYWSNLPDLVSHMYPRVPMLS